MRTGIAVAVVIALSTLASPALALRVEVEAAIDLYRELRFDDARVAFEHASRLEGNRTDDLAAIHLHLGLLRGAEDREDEAEEHFRVALAVDPMVELPAGQPPKITRPFSRARAFWRGARLRVEHQPPRGWVVDRPADIQIEAVDDRLHLISGAHLRVWRVGEEEHARSYRQDGGGPFVFPVPDELLEEEGDIRYSVELLGRASSILLELDEEELRVHVGPRPTAPETLEGDGSLIRSSGVAPYGEDRPRARTALWIGIAAAVVVLVAGAVTLGVVFGTRPDQASLGPLEVRWP